MKLILITIVALTLAFPAMAQEAQAPLPTRIETDNERSEIRFFIDGKLAAVLKDDALHVRHGIRYGDVMIDYGPDGFDREVSGKEQAESSADAP